MVKQIAHLSKLDTNIALAVNENFSVSETGNHFDLREKQSFGVLLDSIKINKGRLLQDQLPEPNY